jgi:hypothetical protein
MTIERISEEEFVKARVGVGLSPETAAFYELDPGQGFKTPCRWAHHTKGNSNSGRVCSGTVLIGHFARRIGVKYSTRCRDGVLYVWRLI